jgi:hypothetical protein
MATAFSNDLNSAVAPKRQVLGDQFKLSPFSEKPNYHSSPSSPAIESRWYFLPESRAVSQMLIVKTIDIRAVISQLNLSPQNSQPVTVMVFASLHEYLLI